MPIKLNVANAARYAVIEPDFIEQMKQIWKKRWAALNEDIKAQNPRFRPMRAERNAPVMSRLKALCTSKDALDRELTRLRGLPYERFYARAYSGRMWLVGLTRPVVMSDDLRSYQAPRYFVYFPDDMTVRGTDAAFHFVPEGYELTTARHPHHNVKTYYYDENVVRREFDMDSAKDPLDFKPATCWGSFGTIAQSCTASGDVVDLYRNIAIYLTRINQNSLLTRPFSACHFLVDIGPAPVEKSPAITRRTKFPER